MACAHQPISCGARVCRCQLVPSVLRWLVFYCKPVVRPSVSFLEYWKRARSIRLPPLLKYAFRAHSHCQYHLSCPLSASIFSFLFSILLVRVFRTLLSFIHYCVSCCSLSHSSKFTTRTLFKMRLTRFWFSFYILVFLSDSRSDVLVI